MSDKFKIAFFAAYFLLAPLAGYYWNNHVWRERIQLEGGRIIQTQLSMMVEWGTGGTLPIPSGEYILSSVGIPPGVDLHGENRDNTILRWK
jgi:hypothetical protein